MVKFYNNHFSYDYSFPTVTLAYFLRYPNPYATHVVSTDVIDRHVDSTTQRLYTLRIHLKRSKIPPAVLKILPTSVLGNTSDNVGQSYILESSVVDLREGWMTTETKNLDWTGVLSVVEKQTFLRPSECVEKPPTSFDNGDHVGSRNTEDRSWTDVQTVITFQSRFGQGKLARHRALNSGEASSGSHEAVGADETPPKRGFLSTWSTTGIQRSIERLGVRRTSDHLARSTEGMNVVLERLRQGGLVGVLEGMRRDRDKNHSSGGPWKRTWQQGSNGTDDDLPHVEHHLDDT
ncbi:MAG: hypothetical protein M1833_005122 [Piccolia ochrophora]|nr:MAG: hypothetical protein M1833_005122 [Piccolia ochrophora]